MINKINKVINNLLFSNKYKRRFHINLLLSPESMDSQLKLMSLRYYCHQLEKAIKHNYNPEILRGQKKYQRAGMIIRSLMKTEYENYPDVIWARRILVRYEQLVSGAKRSYVIPYSRNDSSSTNDLKEIIFNRRSVRFWRDKGISKDIINKIIELGTMAPSSCNRQPWKITVVENIAVDTSRIKPSNKGMIESAPYIIYIAIDRRMHPEIHAPYIDAGVITQNILLAMEYYGLKGCTMYQCETVDQKGLRKILGFSKNDYICIAIPFGFPAESAELPARVLAEDITTYKRIDTKTIIANM